MYYLKLSILKGILNDENINKFDTWLCQLTPTAKKYITAYKVSRELNIDIEFAEFILDRLTKSHFMRRRIGIRCPKCGYLLKCFDEKEFSNTLIRPQICTFCDENIDPNDFNEDNFEVFYLIIDDNPDDKNGLKSEVAENKNKNTDKNISNFTAFAKRVSMKGNEEEACRLFYNPDEQQYDKMQKMYKNIIEPQKLNETTKEKGDRLEDLVCYIFSLSPLFAVSTEVRTTTSQIDITVRPTNVCIRIKILEYVGAVFFIECKNENETLSGDYLKKLYATISLSKSPNTSYIRFGIITCKNKIPRTFKILSHDYYLREEIIMISFDGQDLEELIINKKNLLMLIDEKCIDIMLNANKDIGEYELI